MKLYLAYITIMTREYMSSFYREEIKRLVWANNQKEAEEKINAAFIKEDPYGTDVAVEDIVLYEAL